MDLRPRGGQHRQAQPVASRPTSLQPRTQESTSFSKAAASTKRRVPGKKITALIVAGALTVLVGFLVWSKLTDQIDSSRYQAVFLTNGQVYFGKLHDYYGNRPYMTDVYYFQGSNAGGASQSSTQQLRKLGQEVHGPEQKLILNKDSILFVENLREDSSVVSAIAKGSDGETTANPTGGITR
jgi:hypothetical protein